METVLETHSRSCSYSAKLSLAHINSPNSILPIASCLCRVKNGFTNLSPEFYPACSACDRFYFSQATETLHRLLMHHKLLYPLLSGQGVLIFQVTLRAPNPKSGDSSQDHVGKPSKWVTEVGNCAKRHHPDQKLCGAAAPSASREQPLVQKGLS